MGEYYFITYVTRRLGRQFFESEVIDEHPFNWLKKVQMETNLKTILAGWQKISKEEFEMFLNGEITEDCNSIPVSQSNPVDLINMSPSKGLES
jgi:hypothetical protein